MKALLTIFATLIIGFITWEVHMFQDEYDMRKAGGFAIEKIEAFRLKNGFVPRLPRDAGFDEKDAGMGPFYEWIDSAHYRIHFTQGFDASYSFDSKTGKWAGRK
ncbi:MAG: hypothetical protein AAFV07_09210 [Bacteroidota bacterium]